MKRTLVLASVAAATLLAAGAAQAGHVNWSIGINLPPVATYVSGGPGYYPAPAYAPRRYYAPPRVVVAPAYAPVYSSSYAPVYSPPVYAPPVYSSPVYDEPVYEPRVVYREPRRAYYGPAPVAYARPPQVWLPPLPRLPRLPALPPLPPLPWSHHGDGHVDYRR